MRMTTKIGLATLAIATMLFCKSAMADATSQPAPKAFSTVTGENIVLGDVFENVGDRKDFFLAPAPAVGKTRIIAFNDLVRISDTLGLGWEPNNQSQKTIIRRTANVIGAAEIEEALKNALRPQLGKKDFDVTLSNKSMKFDISEKGDKQLTVSDVEFDAAKMLLSAKVAVVGDAQGEKDVKAFVSYIHEVPVLSESKRKGDVISASDLQYIKMKSSDITANMVVSAENLIGKTPRNAITAMSPIFEADLKLPLLIKKGDVVVMKLDSSFISLTAQGFAAQDGREGDLIRVENLTSKQMVTAVVTGEREVKINAATTGKASTL